MILPRADMEERKPKSSLNVLVVDDELNIRKTLAMSIESDGHKVVAVSNAEDALDQAAKLSFDLAFVDLRLGSAHGLDLIPGLPFSDTGPDGVYYYEYRQRI